MEIDNKKLCLCALYIPFSRKAKSTLNVAREATIIALAKDIVTSKTNLMFQILLEATYMLSLTYVRDYHDYLSALRQIFRHICG